MLQLPFLRAAVGALWLFVHLHSTSTSEPHDSKACKNCCHRQHICLMGEHLAEVSGDLESLLFEEQPNQIAPLQTKHYTKKDNF